MDIPNQKIHVNSVRMPVIAPLESKETLKSARIVKDTPVVKESSIMTKDFQEDKVISKDDCMNSNPKVILNGNSYDSTEEQTISSDKNIKIRKKVDNITNSISVLPIE